MGLPEARRPLAWHDMLYDNRKSTHQLAAGPAMLAAVHQALAHRELHNIEPMWRMLGQSWLVISTNPTTPPRPCLGRVQRLQVADIWARRGHRARWRRRGRLGRAIVSPLRRLRVVHASAQARNGATRWQMTQMSRASGHATLSSGASSKMSGGRGAAGWKIATETTRNKGVGVQIKVVV